MHPQGYWVASDSKTHTKVWVAYDIIHRQFLYRVNDGPALHLPGSMTKKQARTLAIELCEEEAKKHRSGAIRPGHELTRPPSDV